MCRASPVALGAQPIAIRQVTVRHRTTNHTMDIPHMPDGPIRSGDAEASACGRTRGVEGGPSPCPLDLLDGVLATTKALGGLRSTSHWKSGDATKRVSGPGRRNWRSRSGVALPGPLAFHRGRPRPLQRRHGACKPGAQGRTALQPATCNERWFLVKDHADHRPRHGRTTS